MSKRSEPLPGAYVPGSTIAHKLDARTKLVVLLAATVASFAASAPWGLVVVAVGLALALWTSATSPVTVVRGLRPAAVILIFSILANALVLVGDVGISLEGFARGVTAVARIVLVVGFVLAFSSTTMAPAIADAVADFLSPLARLGVPVTDISMMVSVALRFVPIAAEEVERIRAAQRARGAQLDEGGVIERLRKWTQVLVPLLVGLFRRADELACAMCDRCYSGEGRTRLSGKLSARDWAVMAGSIVWCVVAVAL